MKKIFLVILALTCVFSLCISAHAEEITLGEYYSEAVELAPGEKKEVFLPFWRKGHRRELNKGRDIKFRLYFIDPNGFITTTRDIKVKSTGNSYKGIAESFGVNAAPDVNPVK